MDDKKFDEKTAQEWIRIIEDRSANVREKDLYPLLQSWLTTASSKNVLDIGCGQGVCSIQTGQNQISYFGVDPSPDLIARATELYANSSRTFVIGNAYALPFEDTYFDAVFSIAVWHLLSDLKKASYELSRVLKHKGHFLIFTADPYQYQIWMDRYVDEKLNGRHFTGSYQITDGSTVTDQFYLHSLQDITSALGAHGLEVSTVETMRSFVAILGHKQ